MRPLPHLLLIQNEPWIGISLIVFLRLIALSGERARERKIAFVLFVLQGIFCFDILFSWWILITLQHNKTLQGI